MFKLHVVVRRALPALALWALLPASASAQAFFSDGFEALFNTPSSDAEAARFLTQATFGPTESEIARLRQIGYAAWLDQQLALPPTLQTPYMQAIADTGEPVYNNQRMEAWYNGAVKGEDQLRQRMAYALSQIFVISDIASATSDPRANGVYYDMLITEAFSPYRTLLERVTLAPAMGAYLSMLGNRRPDVANNVRPDENYAREILQLFSIGLVELNPDGSVVMQDGAPVPAYDQFHIKTFAHIFTGWHFGNCSGFEFCFPGYPDAVGWRQPMRAFADFHHTEPDADPDNDTLLRGVARPAGGTPEQNLAIALDNIASHPNVGPFIARRLIQHFVTSNPSPAYIARMTAVFDDNGSGLRGDLAALVRAILLDPEARLGHELMPERFGKVREPVLRQTHLWRAFAADSGNGRLQEWNPEFFLGQGPLRAPSVFNFFLPDYQPPGEPQSLDLFAPEVQIINETFVTRTANFFWQAAERAHIGSPFEIYLNDGEPQPDFRPFYADAAAIGPLLDRLDVLLMNGQMSSAMRGTLETFLSGIPYTANNDPGGRVRTFEAVHLIMTSPEYIVQK